MTTKIEERLSIIEQLIGLDAYSLESSATTVHNDPARLSLRIQNLLVSSQSLLKNHPSSSIQKASAQSLESDLIGLKLDNLEQTLDIPHLFLASTASNASSSGDVNILKPLVYRKQEVLACSEELGSVIEQMATIRDLLCKSNPALTKEIQSMRKGDEISIGNIVNAPILISSPLMFAGEKENQEKLVELTERIARINEKVESITIQCDAIINTYYKLITAVNEKLILNHELT